jgi:D-alanine-D-alanine ligase
MQPMSKIAILVNEVLNPDDPADADVWTQCREVSEALSQLGHRTEQITCTLDLASVKKQLLSSAPDLVFNLVESLGGTDRLMPMATMLLDSLQIPHTGSGTRAIARSSDKIQAKIEMVGAGIRTPCWYDDRTQAWQSVANETGPSVGERLIVKAAHEHSSFEMDNQAVFRYESEHQVRQRLRARLQHTGTEHLVEQFVVGREFNLAMLEIDGAPRILAAGEIDFSGLPAELPRIVNAKAKWVAESVEYEQTPRRFDFNAADLPLLDQLSELAIECWELFQLRGYGRVDFRVDSSADAYVLEVNANPCLSQDAGYIAAAEQAQLSYCDVIDALVSAAVNDRRWGADQRHQPCAVSG